MCTYQVVLQTQSRPSLLDTTVITAGTAKGFVFATKVQPHHQVDVVVYNPS